MEAYGFNLVPLRGRVFWEKTNGVQVHPLLYTKVMGRPKKNRRKVVVEGNNDSLCRVLEQ